MSDRFEPDKVWPEGKKLPEGFDASMVLGSLGRALRAECPQLGHRVQDDRADSTGQLQVTDPYEFVLPVMFNHKIELLIAVDSLIDNSTGEDLALVIDDLMLILSASFSRCQPDSDASMTPVGLSAHAGDSSDE